MTLSTEHDASGVAPPATVLPFTSVDGQRRYVVHVHRPAAAAPPAGFPVVYLLDGAAARAAIASAPALRELPVVVATVAHDHDADATKAARAYDYTPPSPDGMPVVDPRVPTWQAGGADAFLDLLDTQIRPAVQAHHPVDATRAVLAGHSYGGLCVLHALCRQRGYAGYVSASPSIWWRDEAILPEVAALAISPAGRSAHVHLIVGEHEAWHARAVGEDGTHRSRRGGAPTAPAAEALARQLSSLPDLTVSFAVLPGESHGTMADAAACAAVRFTATLE